ncbi:MAG: hypothetical protein NC299_11870 [Lachnospiraceae bacterium]|nr:hypothetical protein [Lachnospiraceae bacterium]
MSTSDESAKVGRQTAAHTSLQRAHELRAAKSRKVGRLCAKVEELVHLKIARLFNGSQSRMR